MCSSARLASCLSKKLSIFVGCPRPIGLACQCWRLRLPMFGNDCSFFGDHKIAFFTCSNNKIKVCIFSTASLLGLYGSCALAFLNALEHKRSSFVRALCAFVQQPMKIGLLWLFVRFAASDGRTCFVSTTSRSKNKACLFSLFFTFYSLTF